MLLVQTTVPYETEGTQMPAGSQLKADLSNWDPNNEETWDSKRAWLTLWVTTYSMILAFCT